MKKKISINKKIILSIIISLFLIFAYIGNVYADVGSFESYDSCSDWSSSSDWGSSSWDWDDDDDYSWSSSGSSSSDSDGLGILIVFLQLFEMCPPLAFIFLIIAIIYIRKKKKGGSNLDVRPRINYNTVRPTTPVTPARPNSAEVLKKIQAVDPLFSEEEFIAWTKDVFVKLQNQWMARDWEEIRCFETNELFEQHKNQIQGYIDKKQINMLERICVNYADLYNFKQVGDKDILEVALNSSMVDYIIDEETKKVLMGDTVTRRTRTYKLTFIRKTGIKTQEGEAKVNTTNCPNCGAPTEITTSGKCNYCGSVITTGEFDWALSNLEPLR